MPKQQIAPLPDVGICSYAGFRFSALFHTNVEGKVIKTRDRRATKWHEITLTVDGVVIRDDSPFGTPVLTNPPNSTDAVMMDMRIAFTKSAQPLIYSLKGFGPLVVNSPGTQGNTYDLALGPDPELLSFTPLGAGRSAHIVWKVTVHVAESSLPKFKGVVEFTRSDGLTYDKYGYLTYTVQGNLEIAATVNQADIETDLITNYIQAHLNAIVPVGFTSARRDFQRSEDRRACTFNYTWEEMAIGGLPVACTGADGEYSIGNTDKGFGKWTASLSASYYVQKDVLRNSAYMRFIGLFLTRVRNVVNRPGRFPTNPANDGVILTGFRAREGLYEGSKRNEFEMTWTRFMNVRNAMLDSSIWMPVPDSNYRLWAFGGNVNNQPFQQNPFVPPANPAGQVGAMAAIMGWASWDKEIDRAAQSAPSPGGVDAIIDIYHQPPVGPNNCLLNRRIFDIYGDLDEKDHPNFKTFVKGLPNTPDKLGKLILMSLPPPGASWGLYFCELFTELDPGLVVHKQLPQNNDPADTLATLDYQDPNFATNTGDYNLNSQSTGNDIVQRMATSTYKICLRGFASRCGYAIPIPGLVSFNGVKNPTPMRPHRVWRSAISSIGGIPINLTRWELWYQCTVAPKVKTVDPFPQNPAAALAPVKQTPASVTVPQGVFGVRIQEEYPARSLQTAIPLKPK